MKPRHAAVLALVGWYLMMPPPTHLPLLASPPLGLPFLASPPPPPPPLEQWEQVAAYDTAKECELAKYELAKAAVKDEQAQNCNVGSRKTSDTPRCQQDISKENTRCIATDD
jgi:hypothetical protein